MSTTDLLNNVLPSEGWYCIVGLKKGDMPKQQFVESIGEVDALVQELLTANMDVYFGCAKFLGSESRAQKNATYFKSFWLDIDCGVGKPYADHAEGNTALDIFCTANTLPRPTLVNSGRGLHAYWPLTSTINRLQWQVVANKLKQLCEQQSFEIDPSVPADSARILRVPETFNFKDINNPLGVKVLHLGEPTEYELLRQIIGAAEAPKEEPAPFISTRPSALTLALAGNRVSVFKTIMIKTAAGEGCAQLAHIVMNQEGLDEPLWRAGLSIANVCEDRDIAITNISNEHNEYNPAYADKKARDTKGPYTCATFEKLRAGGCDGCAHKGKIKSPVVLGHDIARAEEEGDGDEGYEERDEDDPVATTSGGISASYPWPFFRGKVGGVYKEVKDDTPTLVYEHDLIVTKRLVDPNSGECALVRRFLPQDGWKEFSLPLVSLTSKEELRKAASLHGIVAMPKAWDNIMAYMVASVKELQVVKSAEKMRTQFGWADNDTKFILGDKEISQRGVVYSPPSVTTMSLAPFMEPKGDFHEWKSVFDTYALQGFEPHAFATLSAFGAPLLKFLDLKGCLINLVNNTSGTGKSTILRMSSSVYGHPEEQLLNWKDTYNSIVNRFGVMNNLMVGIDELTKMSADLFSDLAYSMSQGRGKNRMKQSANEERINTTKWATIFLATSNASFYDKLMTLKNTPDGEMMRMLEYRIDLTNNLNKAKADSVFSKLHTNYGHAMAVYMAYVVENLPAVIETIKRVQNKIDKDVGMDSRDRFWSGTAACNIAGGIIAQNLNLHSYDMKRIYGWAIPMLTGMKRDVGGGASINYSEIIGDFITQHISNILIVDAKSDLRTNLYRAPLMEPRGELLIRYEPDTKQLSIVRKAFRKFCSENQITYNDVLTELKTANVLLGDKKKQMTRGTKMISPPIDALIFDGETFDLLDITGLTPDGGDGTQ